ncbi:MAG: DUF2218 domain-containing protein [Litoreibacter sp.]|nr:DUF2218 domain-containing protein [Litoreibacter sp.]MCY4334254.1 DUF2218 domain-containing protein [Litoreibacter sp.]
MNTTASFETDRASRYLKALCHHFGRKVDAKCDETAGWVQFPFGRCDLKAGVDKLELTASADDQRQLTQVVKIVTSHLERFAFREDPKLEWASSEATPNHS